MPPAAGEDAAHAQGAAAHVDRALQRKRGRLIALSILGCRLDDIDTAAATERIVAWAGGSRFSHVVTLGTEMVVYAQRNREFRSVVNNAALSLCDTIGLLLVARLRGSSLRERVTGVELIGHICAGAARTGAGVYFLGAAPGVAEAAAQALKASHAELQVCGVRDGYFPEAASAAVAASIAASGAKILFVGLGSPRQEMWIRDYGASTGCAVAIGIGGSLDVIGGKVARAPRLWRRLGMEWLYRLSREPRRWRRQLALPQFVALMLLDFIGLRRRA